MPQRRDFGDACSIANDYLIENDINIEGALYRRFVDELIAHPTLETRTIASAVGIAPSRPRIRRVSPVSTSEAVHSMLEQYMNADDFDNLPFETEPIRESIGEPLSDQHMGVFASYTGVGRLRSRERDCVARTERPSRRSEIDMMMDIVVSDEFPRPNFKDWSSSSELQRIIDDWYNKIQYKEQWIFARREREGFNRRNIRPFSLDDIMARMTKRKKEHHLNNGNSKFYDWKLGGTDWLLRLELFEHGEHYFLISRYIHKPSNIEIKYDIRYWNGDSFQHLISIFSEHRENDTLYDRSVGNGISYGYGDYGYDEEACVEDCEEDF